MSRMPISRQIDTIVESMMFMVTMSMGVLPFASAHHSGEVAHQPACRFRRLILDAPSSYNALRHGLLEAIIRVGPP